MSRSRGDVRLVTVLLALIVVSSACAPTTSQTAVPAGPAVPPSHAERQDPAAPATYRPVVRSGKKSHATLKANRGSLATADGVTYPDGVVLKVRRSSSGVEKATGPGAFPGRPYVAFSMSLDNRSPRTLDLNKVVVTAIYGSPGRLAQPVYKDGGGGKDLSGIVPPGGSASATYAFAVPEGQRGAVKVIVDFDNAHAAAQFSGAAR